MCGLVTWTSVTTNRGDFFDGRFRASNSEDVFDLLKFVVNGRGGVTSEEEDAVNFGFEGFFPIGNVERTSTRSLVKEILGISALTSEKSGIPELPVIDSQLKTHK